MNNQLIMVVDDNPGDIELIKKGFKAINVDKKIFAISDGLVAKTYLEKIEHTNDLPKLIILDLNMPKISGKKLLGFIKSNGFLKKIPVIIFSSSNHEKDVSDSYELNANCFITKPVALDDFLKSIKSIYNFWFETAQLPLSKDE